MTQISPNYGPKYKICDFSTKCERGIQAPFFHICTWLLFDPFCPQISYFGYFLIHSVLKSHILVISMELVWLLNFPFLSQLHTDVEGCNWRQLQMLHKLSSCWPSFGNRAAKKHITVVWLLVGSILGGANSTKISNLKNLKLISGSGPKLPYLGFLVRKKIAEGNLKKFARSFLVTHLQFFFKFTIFFHKFYYTHWFSPTLQICRENWCWRKAWRKKKVWMYIATSG